MADPGLRGEYRQLDYVGPSVPTAHTRTDPTIDFDWGFAPAGTPIDADGRYSVSWTGYVHVESPGSWTFLTQSSDGVRLWIDGDLVVDDWIRHTVTTRSKTVHFPHANWYPIRLDYHNNGGSGTVKLLFQGPNRPQGVIPATHLDTDFRGFTRPSVSAGADRDYLIGSGELALDGGVSYSGPGACSIVWRQTDGPSVEFDGNLQPIALVTPTASGAHAFQLDVVLQNGAWARDVALVHVHDPTGSGAAVNGTRRKWHKLTLDFAGPFTDEDAPVNPFTDYRLQVRFFHQKSGTAHDVPGFFAADGDAADSGARAGDVWRANFVPDRTGLWTYVASFRAGTNVALSLEPLAGTRNSFDGASGSFWVEAPDPVAPGFVRHGLLEYVGESYLRFAETHERFLKGGANSPENLLGYYEFDDTFDLGGNPTGLDQGPHSDGVHHFDAHLGDYAPSAVDATWKNGKGQRILGALEYLASMGVNAQYFLTYNADGGDGQEVWPWRFFWQKDRYDVSKLDQWGRVLDHMTNLGIAQHVVTQEIENYSVLDLGNLGRERKLYYRELVARFAHSLALTWSLGEESLSSDGERMSYADYIRALDPYDHPITIHTLSGEVDDIYVPLLGFENFESPSLQIDNADVHASVVSWLAAAEAAGRPWVVHNDEQTPAQDGVVPDSVDLWHSSIRKNVLWGNLMAGGGGVEYYFGYGHPHDDLDCEDFRSRDQMWWLTGHALDFLQDRFYLQRTTNADELTATPADYVLATPGTTFAVYNPDASPTTLDLQGSQETFTVEWLNARWGAPLLTGTVAEVTGPGVVSIGTPPGLGDFVALVSPKENAPAEILEVTTSPSSLIAGRDFAIQARVEDRNGPVDVKRVFVSLWTPLPLGGRSTGTPYTGEFAGQFVLKHAGGNLYSILFEGVDSIPGTWHYLVTAKDRSGALTYARGTFEGE